MKRFVTNDASQYEQLTVKYVHGKSPTLRLYGDDNQMIEQIDLSHHRQQAIHNLLKEKGFVKKSEVVAEVNLAAGI